jgi:hypothetical protein
MTQVPARPLSDASTRELFGELVTEASCELGRRPSPMASGYLVDLLEARVRSARALAGGEHPPDTLAESLVAALLADGTARMARLRSLGDRALFDAGFFGDSLRRKTVGVTYYAEIGSTAYARLSKGTGSPLFRELAFGFLDFVELLAEVGARARGSRSVDLLRLYDRYRASHDPRDRARLLRHGLILPDAGALERLQ